MQHCPISKDTPYPTLVDPTPNVHTVAILQNLLAAHNSELTAVLQYTFQTQIVSRFDRDIAKRIAEVARVEMHHMDLLGNAIVAFGGKPKFKDARNRFFNGVYVNYADNLKAMLQANIESEECACLEYERAAKEVRNASLQDLLLRIRDEEVLHRNLFEKILLSACFWSE